ncbi:MULTISPECIES: type III pantothenate kinase [Idiomarina]|uniref:Type III pantothenate kinase n=1 Tax=Idiomarina loihiensis (strain ATCC BAA-735 / DSM 15497 / L2-TR) TaxID=283942 RepID=COAX_IDILO|nr:MULTISPECIES: type III pantothenate kinase [Idiomarina]Q5QY78.1 RecName: Full=Type III pantothenate kinase; AltName: Full=PanK-III; AltName: Full=Pantothenic acid kinase [Idiomarina loihiensis L2TR]AAV82834.1 Predicted transcriptional regulator [Idiomarina loihiensis L2TR]AGM36877.1 transcriptional regulator [Idiomarina loihiensis GSL 199]
MLLIDAGNTRSKFAWWDADTDKIEILGAIPHQSWLNDLSQPLKDLLLEVVSSRQLEREQQAIGCSVAAVQVMDTLNSSLAELGIKVFWQKTRAQQAGVTNGYTKEPERLGSDRWMALLGCHEQVKQNALIVDAGTALTIDWLMADGRHLGGWIVPGRQLMLNALGQGTANLKGITVNDIERDGLAAGLDTFDGITQGAEAALTGAIAQAIQLSGRYFSDQPFDVVVTGGDGEHLMRTLSVEFCRYDDLLFKGLRLCADNLNS